MTGAGPAAIALALWALAAAPLPPARPLPATAEAPAAALPASPDAAGAEEAPGAITPADAAPPETPASAAAPAGPIVSGPHAPGEAAAPVPAGPERLAREVAERLTGGSPTPPSERATDTAASPADGAVAEAPGESAAAAPPSDQPAEAGMTSPATGQAAPEIAASEPVKVAIASDDQRRPAPRPGSAPASPKVQTVSRGDDARSAAPRAAAASGGTVSAPLPPRRGAARGEARAAPRADGATGSGKLATAALPAAIARPAPGNPTERQPDQFVCRDPRLAGAVIPAIGGAGTVCGIANPVRLTGIDGIRFDTPATVDCPTARRIAHWLTGVAEPLARAELGSRIVEVDVMGSYACRTRNNRPGGRLSEHALGRALDVGGFRLADGTEVSVRNHWGGGAKGRFLKKLHRASCGLFMTVLGPNSDRYHHDHFHLDTALRNGNPYCR